MCLDPSLTPVTRAGSTVSLSAALSSHGLVPEILQRGRDVPALNLCLVREGLARFSTDRDRVCAPGPRVASHPRGRPPRGCRRLDSARGGRRGGRRLCAHRARCRIRCRLALAPGRARRRRLSADWRKGLHLQRARGRHLHRLRRTTPAPAHEASPPSRCLGRAPASPARRSRSWPTTGSGACSSTASRACLPHRRRG